LSPLVAHEGGECVKVRMRKSVASEGHVYGLHQEVEVKDSLAKKWIEEGTAEQLSGAKVQSAPENKAAATKSTKKKSTKKKG